MTKKRSIAYRKSGSSFDQIELMIVLASVAFILGVIGFFSMGRSVMGGF